MRSIRWPKCAAALCVALVGVPALAVAAEPAPKPAPAAVVSGPPPAVDGISGKITALGGVTDSRSFYGGTGSITVPLGFRFGLQVDAAVAGIDSKYQGGVVIGGGALHLFWRNPRVGMVGLYGQYLHSSAFDGIDTYAAGAQGALFLGRFTIEGVLGAQGGHVDLGVLGGGNFQTRFFDIVRLSYYPTDNLRLSVGHGYVFARNSAFLGAEWGFPVGRSTLAAVFVNGGVSEEGTGSVAAGVRFYFGRRAKPLIRRHREDDPPVYLSTGSMNIGFGTLNGWNSGSPNFGGGTIGDGNRGIGNNGEGSIGWP